MGSVRRSDTGVEDDRLSRDLPASRSISSKSRASPVNAFRTRRGCPPLQTAATRPCQGSRDKQVTSPSISNVMLRERTMLVRSPRLKTWILNLLAVCAAIAIVFRKTAALAGVASGSSSPKLKRLHSMLVFKISCCILVCSPGRNHHTSPGQG